MFHTLLALLLAAPVAVLPGWLLLKLLPARDRRPVEEAFMAIALGVWLVSYSTVTIVGLVGLFAPIFVRAWLLALVAAVYCVLFLWRLSKRGPLTELLRLARPDRTDVLVFLAALAVGAYALLHYDRMFFDEERCIIRSSVLPYHNYWKPNLPMTGFMPEWMFHRNAFLFWNGGQREGMAFVLTPFLAVFEYLGFRACFAFSHFAVAGGVYTIVRRLTERRWLGVVAMGVLCLNPYTMRMMDVDDNIFALAAGTVAIAFLLRRPVNWFWFMLPYGLFLGIRHEALLTLPGVLAWIALDRSRRSERSRTLRHLALGGLAFTFPYLLFHALLVLTSKVPYEAFVTYGAVPHSFLGIDFSVPGLLNWPFVDQLVRSPFTAYPPLLAFPLDMLNSMGLFLWALVPAGLLWLWRRDRAFLWLGVLWLLPFMSLLLVQSNWTEQDKMGIPNTVLTPVAVWMVLGLWGLLNGRDPVWKRAALPVVSLLLLWGAVLGAGQLSFPVDERGFAFRPFYIEDDFPVQSLDEDPALIESERERMSTPRLVPYLSNDGYLTTDQFQRMFRRRAGALVEDLAHPEFEHYRPSVPVAMRHLIGLDELMHFPVTDLADRGAGTVLKDLGAASELDERPTVVVELDLSRPPTSNDAIVVPATGPGPEPIPMGRGEAMRVADIPLPWTTHHATVAGISGYFADTTLTLFFGTIGQNEPPEIEGATWLEGSGLAEPRIRLAVPAGSLLALAQFTSLKPTRQYVWLFTVHENGTVSQAGPRPF